MIPFFFTRYRKAPLATCVSFLSSMCYLIALLFSVGYLLNWSGLRDEMQLGPSLLMAACFAAIGVGLMKLGEWLAIRKQRKLAEKAGSAATARPTPVPAAPAACVCPKCGTRAEPGDAFCVNCGTKL